MASASRPRNVGDLRKLELRGDCPDFLFLGAAGRSVTAEDRSWVPSSQWWPAPFGVGGVTYPTAEHFMMAGKARLFGDEDMASRIIEASSPGDAKALGRAIEGYDEKLWAASRYVIVVEGNIAKFGQHPDLLAFLAATAGSVLVEASPADRVWASAWPPTAGPSVRRSGKG